MRFLMILLFIFLKFSEAHSPNITIANLTFSTIVEASFDWYFSPSNDSVVTRMNIEENIQKKSEQTEESDIFQKLKLNYPILNSKILNNKTLKNVNGVPQIDTMINTILTYPCKKQDSVIIKDIDNFFEKEGETVYQRYYYTCAPKDEIDCPNYQKENTLSDFLHYSNLTLFGSDGNGVDIKEVIFRYDCLLDIDETPTYLSRTDRLHLLGHTWATYLSMERKQREKVFLKSEALYIAAKMNQRKQFDKKQRRKFEKKTYDV